MRTVYLDNSGAQSFKLIITVVKKGWGSKVVTASKKAGAEGGTIFMGRGTDGKDSYLKLLGLEDEAEKEIVLTIVKEEISDAVIDIIEKECRLNKPGNGIAFILHVKELAGICHLLGVGL